MMQQEREKERERESLLEREGEKQRVSERESERERESLRESLRERERALETAEAALRDAHKEWEGETKEWEKEVLGLKEVVQAEEEEELCRLAAAFADMHDGITEERRERERKMMEWEREKATLCQEMARVMGDLRVELAVLSITFYLSLALTQTHIYIHTHTHTLTHRHSLSHTQQQTSEACVGVACVRVLLL